jgi:hypothetical protein
MEILIYNLLVRSYSDVIDASALGFRHKIRQQGSFFGHEDDKAARQQGSKAEKQKSRKAVNIDFQGKHGTSPNSQMPGIYFL